MSYNRVYERLADKSAFVVFDKDSFKTYVVQTHYFIEYCTKHQPALLTQPFESLSTSAQINLFELSGINIELS